jgi:hypothetical protein
MIRPVSAIIDGTGRLRAFGVLEDVNHTADRSNKTANEVPIDHL